MLTLQYVEDYVEVLAGHRSPVTGKLDNNSLVVLIGGIDPPINLARYDSPVIHNVITAIQQNVGMTERQAHLICKIVLKYHRQLGKLGVDVAPLRDPQYRIPLRTMDYSKQLLLNETGDKLLVKFPYNTDLIANINQFKTESCGEMSWDRANKVWVVALTEYNLNLLYSWA